MKQSCNSDFNEGVDCGGSIYENLNLFLGKGVREFHQEVTLLVLTQSSHQSSEISTATIIPFTH